MPVMQTLDATGVNYAILADSTAKTLLNGNPHLAPLPQDVAELARNNPHAANQAQFKLNQAANAPCIVSGLVSSFQKTWADFFRGMGKTVVGYYDGFGYNTWRNKADEFAGSLSVLLTPSRDTAIFFSSRFRNIPVLALGQPTLETIPSLLQRTHLPALANALGIDSSKPTLLFVGGYGEGYEQAFDTFCQAVKTLPQSNVLVSLHPKVDGAQETGILKMHGLEKRVRIVPKSIDTAQVLGISNVILSQNSTMTIQAGMQGKKVLLVGNAGSAADRYEFNPATYYGMTSRYKTPSALANAVNSILGSAEQRQSERVMENDRLYWLLGIPKYATSAISSFLLSLIPASASGLNRAA